MIKSSHTANLIEVGCDEAGRGSLAGPVVSCSVIFPKKIKIKEINDSKLLSINKRIKLEKIIKEIDYSLIQEVTTFDVYEGDNIPKDKKSVAINVTLQSPNKTLSEKDIDQISKKIIDVVKEKTGATIRS